MSVIAQLQSRVVEVIERELAPLMVGSMRWTVIARDPSNDDTDVLITEDSLEGIAGLVERSKQREPTWLQRLGLRAVPLYEVLK